MSFSITWEKEVEYQGRQFKISGESTFQWVDNGIGPYEYWGCKGNDVRMECEWQSDENVLLTEFRDEDSCEETLIEDEDLINKIRDLDEVCIYINDQAEEYDEV